MAIDKRPKNDRFRYSFVVPLCDKLIQNRDLNKLLIEEQNAAVRTNRDLAQKGRDGSGGGEAGGGAGDVGGAGDGVDGKEASTITPANGIIKRISPHGPRVLIVTPSWRSAKVMEEQFHSYLKHLGPYQRPRILVAYGGQEKSEGADGTDLSVELFNGCDVLIATPHKLETLLLTKIDHEGGELNRQTWPKTNLCRLFHLVFVEADRLVTDRFFPSVQRILQRFVEDMKLFENRKRRDYRHAVIVARSWTPALGNFVREYANKPVYIFARR